MKHGLLSFFTAAMLIFVTLPCKAYDFSAVAPSGQTLYYNIVNGEAQVTYNYSYSIGGNLIIPDTVTYNGSTYSVTSIGDYAFFYLYCACTSLTSVTIPNSVTTIGEGAFVYCTSLTSITIPNSVTSIGSNAFDECFSLTSITIPNSVTTIGGGAFSYCTSLTSVTIPNSVTSIGVGTFRECTSLTSVTIPNSVTSIGGSAFSNCSSLTSITIPNSVTTIGGDAFQNDTNIVTVVVMPDNPVYDSRNGCNAIIETASNTLIFGCKATIIPNSVTSIGNGAFWGCSSLTSITIPNSVTSIGDDAFNWCTSLTSITIPNSVTSIGDDAFDRCSSLTSITIPNSVTSIGDGAFIWCTSLTNVTIPNSVTSIGDYTFYGCTSLTNATIPDSVIYIGNYAFYGCTSLTNVTIPDSVIYFGNSAFYGCTSLTSITIPNPVTSIGNYAFYGCTSLTNVTIPDSVIYIGNYAFYECSSLTSVIIIPNTVTSIGNYAFYGCTSLTNVTIPNSVTSIGDYTFANCHIDTLNMGHFVPFYLEANGGLLFANIINIPCGATWHYQVRWGGGGNYHEPDPAVLTLSALDNNGTVTIESQNTQQNTLCIGSTAFIQATANYGYHFMQWDNGNTANPDTLHLIGDSTVTAIFAKNLYSVTGISQDDIQGTVTGSNTVEYLDTVTLTVIPNYGYHFSQWNDGNTDNPRMVTATQDFTFTAQFDYNQYSITLDLNDSVRGTVNGEGEYDYLSQRTISATANYGYHFTQWNDGNTDNPRTITLTQDTSFTAQFAKNQYALTITSSDNAIGTVSGGGIYEYLDEATITATSTAAHHHFVQWSDGETDTLLTITVTQDLSLTAIFAIDTHQVATTTNNELYGSVDGAGFFPYGSTVTLTPNPENGYYFVYWNNSDTANPNTFTVTGDTLLSALFAPEIVPSICMVSVENDHNVLSWEKEYPVSFYNIYCEGNTSNEYELIATIPYTALSTYADTASRPRTRSYRYRLSATDIYGHEGDLSDIHKTMHLTISQGVGNQWNLVWTEYEGADYTTYVIYRGTDATNIQQIDVMPSGGNFTYTDVNAPAGDVYYQVGIMLSSPCNPTKSNYLVLSNIATNSTVGIHTNHTDEAKVYAYNGRVMVSSESAIQDVRIFDITGKLLKTVAVNGNDAVVNISDFASGVYMVQVHTANGFVTRKIVR